MAPSSKQVVKGLVAFLCDYVPERNLNAADRGHRGGTTLVLIPHHPGDQIFNVEGIGAENITLFQKLVDKGANRQLLPFERCLPCALDAGIGMQGDEKVVA